MFKRKDYQDKALSALERFFDVLRGQGLAQAWNTCAPQAEKRGLVFKAPYNADALGEVPAVCIRIPTGGGKTFLAAHTVPLAGRKLADTEAPVALWLVPTDTIRSQTLAALCSPKNLCNEALREAFGENFRACSIEDLATVGPQEVGASAIIVVATIQTFNVKEKAQRNVYAFDESYVRLFQNLTPQQEAFLDKVTEADLETQPYLTTADLGKVKTSPANWLALRNPIIIVDEAHNNRTDQAFRTLKNLNPACVIEFTATPAYDSNVLFQVGALALQREDMIKLPIVLMEHPTGWKDAVRDAVLTRDRLETLAQKEPEYIRPIVLFQAEPKNGVATISVLYDHLVSPEGEGIDKSMVIKATGEEKGLKDVILGDPGPVRYIITVEALKEGWDCPFAYVLCSLQDVHSAKDVEQLLGRVLRMPYASPRDQIELSKAYAHIVSKGFAKTADELADRLVKNMGFESYEAVQAIAPVQDMFPLLEGGSTPSKPIESAFSLPAVPQQQVPEELKTALEIRPTSAGATVILRGELTEAVEEFLLSACNGRHRDDVKEAIDKERIRQKAILAPSARGLKFAPLPQLCMEWDGALQPVEKQLLAELGEFDLFAETISLSGFSVVERGITFEIDLDSGGKIIYGEADSRQLHLNEVPSHASEDDLVRWLDRECRNPHVSQPVMRKWLLATTRHLIADRGLSLTTLVRGKYPLAEALRREIERRKKTSIKVGFQKSLPGLIAAPQIEDSFRYSFTFHPTHYPARPPYYSGKYSLQKHYYPTIHDLREKRADGKPAEEFLCARAINSHPMVKFWVRNVEREPKQSFWLPTSDDYFYPDFVCELTDGRILVVEYKGEPYKTNDDSREKSHVGHQWEKSSGGKCLFLFAVQTDDMGRSVEQQIDFKIGQI